MGLEVKKGIKGLPVSRYRKILNINAEIEGEKKR